MAQSIPQSSSVAPRRVGLGTWLARLLLTVALWLTLACGVAVAGPLEDAVSQLAAAEATTASLVAERHTLEAEHRVLTSRVEDLKAAGSLVDDYALRDALRAARASAETLNALSEQIRSQREREAELRRQVVVQYDALIAALERKLIAVSPSEQVEVIASLEALQLAREDFRRAFSVALDPFEPIAMPDLDRLDGSDPEELMAAADELADNEEKLRGRLGELESRIEALERRRRLVAFAEDSADEADLFGEEARTTRVRSSRSSENTVDEPSTTPVQSDPGRPNAPVGEDQGAPEPVGSGGITTPDPSTPDPSLGSFDGDIANEARGGPQLDDRGGLGPSTPDLGGPAGLPPASSGSSTTTVVRSDADPGVVAASGSSRSGGSLDAELKRLKSQRKKLEGDIERVSKKQQELRQRARSF